MSTNEPQSHFPSTQPTERGLMPWLRQLATWGRALSRRLQRLEDLPPGHEVFISYNWNDPDNQPDKPPQDGDGYGWSRFSDNDATWMSQKVAPSLWEGEWGRPVLIRGRDGHSTLRVAIVADPGTVFRRDEPGATASPTSITLSLSVYYGAQQISPSELSSITWTYPDGSTASTTTIDVTPGDISGESKIKVDIEWDGITAKDEITLLDVAGGVDSLYAALDFDQLVFKYTPSGTETTITPTTIQGNALAYHEKSQVTPDSVEWQRKDGTTIKTGTSITVGHSQSQVDAGTADVYVNGELHLVAVVSYNGKTVEAAETLYDASDGAGMNIVFSDCPVKPATPAGDQSNWADNGWYNNVYDDTGSDYSHLDNINWMGAFSSAPGSPAEKDAYRDTTDNTSYIYYNSAWQQLMDIWRSEKKEGTDQWSEPERVKGEKGDKGTPGQNTYTAYYPHSNQNDKPSTPSKPPASLTPSSSPDSGWYWDQDTAANNGYVWFLSIKGSRHEPGDSDWSNDVWSEPIQIRGEKGASYKNYQPTTTGSPLLNAEATDDSGETVEDSTSDLTSLPQIPDGWSKESCRYVIRFEWSAYQNQYDQGNGEVELWVGGKQVFYGDVGDSNMGELNLTQEMDDADYPHTVYVSAYNGPFGKGSAYIDVYEVTGEVMVTDE